MNPRRGAESPLAFREVALDLVFFLIGAVLALDAFYLVVLAVAALWRRPTGDVPTSSSRLVILVPAYNEADYIKRCLDSLQQQDYPGSKYSIVVVADNCTDATATIARTCGVEVLERSQPDARGKGRALRWAMDQVLAQPPAERPDAIVVVDADSVVEAGLLAGLAAALDAGADVVQGDYQVLQEERSAQSDLRTAAFLLFHHVRFGGRAVLGLPCNLVGNGMLLRSTLLERHPWDAFTGAEDLEYSIGLRLIGVGPKFAPDARLWGPVPSSGRAVGVQQRRWIGGRLYVVRTQLPKLIGAMFRRRDRSLLDAVVDLATPPLGLLATLGTAGSVAALLLFILGVMPLWPAVGWLVALAAIPTFVVVGFRAARCPAGMYRSLAVAPVVVAAQLLGYVPLVKGLGHTAWERTERPSESRDV